MPHIHIQHYPRDFTPGQLKDIDEAVTAAVTRAFGIDEEAVSISLEPVAPEDWTGRVLDEIGAHRDRLLREPGYWNEK
ncbi:tautomerase family protein [Streptomyces sp. NPDC048603]|uniref:tautomerase family protein n=1 Tax=Streptomyces sp. NPDC048603 TaxID=3365577 RepID=UPI003714996E